MEVQVNLERVLALTKERLAAIFEENIMLQAVIQEQQEELHKLRKAVDSFADHQEEKELESRG